MAESLISVDDHVVENPRVWTDRLSRRKWGDRIPHLEEQPDGSQRWMVDGEPLPLRGVASVGALLPDRAQDPRRWEEVPEAAYDPAARLKAMDADNVDCSVLYPTVAGLAGESFARLRDPELEQACVQAYNDWLVEEWASESPRLTPQCIVPVYPPDAAVAEIERAVAKGHRGVIYPAIPMHLRDVPHVNNPEYDAIWDACQSLGVPLCLHAGASPRVRLPVYEGLSPGLAAALKAVTGPASGVFDVVNLLFSRILLRFPRLRVVFAESALGWGTFLLEYADHQFEQDHCEGYELTPSQMFRRQCFFTGWYDPVGPHAPHVGLDNILWATNFPTATSTWPETQRHIERCFQGMSPDDRRRVLWDNAAELYRIDVPLVQDRIEGVR